MTSSLPDLLGLALAGLLLGLNVALSIGFRLGMERRLLIASIRMVMQLAAIGLILKFVLQQGSLAITAALAFVMFAAASWDLISAQTYRIGERWEHWGLSAGTLLFSSLVGTLYTVTLIVANDPWWSPRVFLPLLGLILGNTLAGIALMLDTLTTAVRRERPAIEARLALGQSRIEALSDVLAAAMRVAMMPILSAMTTAGIVALPGLMTGQILAGADPVEAARYQIIIFCAVAGTTALSVCLAGIGAIWLLTDDRQRLRADRLVAVR